MSRRALLIATSQYSDPQIATLHAPGADAQGLREVLSDPRIGSFDVSECLDAPGERWRHRISDFFLDAARDDLLLLYISGHGVKDRNGKLYFAASDTQLNRLLATGISAGFIQEAAQTSHSRRVIMIFDTCFSGAFAKGFQHRGDSPINAGEYFQDSTGMVVITASGALQYALEDNSVQSIGAPSLFTKHLIHGLKSGDADSDGDGQVTSEDLYRYVRNEVKAQTQAQRPQRWAFGLEGDFVVASNPNPRAGELPEDIVALMEHPLPELRLHAILRLDVLLGSKSMPTVLAARMALERLASEDENRIVSGGAAAALSTPDSERKPVAGSGNTAGTQAYSEVVATSPGGSPVQGDAERGQQATLQAGVGEINAIAAEEWNRSQKLRLRYWTAFREYLREHDSSLSPQKPNREHWYAFGVGTSRAHTEALLITREDKIAVQLVMNLEDAKEVFRNLYSQKDAVENAIGEPLEWREMPDRRSSRIVLFKSADGYNEDTWPVQFGWLQEKLEAFDRIFRPLLAQS